MSDEDNSEGDGEEDGAGGGDCGIEKNLNAATIIQQEREKREKAKLESQKKKEKDKEDRWDDDLSINFPKNLFIYVTNV